MNLIIEEIKSWTNLEIGFVMLEILFGVASILIVAKLTSIQETLEKVSKELKKERTMPNSLKSRLKKLKYQGLLSEKDLSRIYTDNDVMEELEKIKAEFEEQSNTNFYENGWWTYVSSVLDKHISELKGE